jgi:hypothetical protein
MLRHYDSFAITAKKEAALPAAAPQVAAAKPTATPPSVAKAPAQTKVQTPAPPAYSGPKKEYAIALYDNEVDDEEELAFKVGERIEVIEKDASGWYRGRLNGREGLFPVNYVKLE